MLHSPITECKNAIHNPRVIEAFLSLHSLAGFGTHQVPSQFKSVASPQNVWGHQRKRTGRHQTRVGHTHPLPHRRPYNSLPTPCINYEISYSPLSPPPPPVWDRGAPVPTAPTMQQTNRSGAGWHQSVLHHVPDIHQRMTHQRWHHPHSHYCHYSHQSHQNHEDCNDCHDSRHSHPDHHSDHSQYSHHSNYHSDRQHCHPRSHLVLPVTCPTFLHGCHKTGQRAIG